MALHPPRRQEDWTFPGAFIDHRETHGATQFRAIMLGRSADWSFRGLAKNERVQLRLGTLARATNTRSVFAPVPGFNAVLADEKEMGRSFLVKGALVYRHSTEGQAADAVKLETRQAYAVSPANCPIIVASNGDKLIAAHAGRWSLFSPDALQNKESDGRAESIVDTIVHQLTQAHDITELRVWIYGGVRGEHFPHPLSGVHQEINKALLVHIKQRLESYSIETSDGCFLLDLPQVISKQFCHHGASERNISYEHAYLDPRDAWIDGCKGAQRNLFFVARS